MCMHHHFLQNVYSKPCLKRSLKKKTKIDFQGRLSLKAGQKCSRLLQGEQSAILSTFIKLPFVINIFVLSIFQWPFKTGFTVLSNRLFVYLIRGVHDQLGITLERKKSNLFNELSKK